MRAELSENLNLEALTEAEQKLVNRARNALASINRSFEMKLGDGLTATEVACAIVYRAISFTEKPGELILDFKAHRPGEVGQAFIGPQVTLTAELFHDDRFTLEFLMQLEDSFKTFNIYCQTEP